jgi:hypothetical protein
MAPPVDNTSASDRPSLKGRLIVAMVVATAAALVPLTAYLIRGRGDSDFGQVLFASKAVLHGRDPYTLIGPGREYGIDFPLLYPLTAAVAILPLSGLSEIPAVIVFVWISAALLAYSITADDWSRLPLFLSASFLIAVRQVQWSPILTAAACLPALAWICVAKPNIGLAILASTASLRTLKVAAVGGTTLVLCALLLLPQWPREWLDAVLSRRATAFPIVRPWGWIALLGLLRWRRPEARLIFAMACVPQTTAWYEILPLFLVPQSFRESLTLALLSSAPVAFEIVFGSADGVRALFPSSAAMMLFAYLPTILMVLRRPNEGEPPAWLIVIRQWRRLWNREEFPIGPH